MKNSLSIFLDSMRIFAATVVLLSHFSHAWQLQGIEHAFDYASHAAVIVFFVLSGYVITHSSINKNPQQIDLFHYMAARIARLYSVLLPSLTLTAVLLIVGELINPAHYENFHRGTEWMRFALSIGFVQNIWGLSAAPPTNGPLWSLSYEFWYYAIFGILQLSNSRMKWPAGLAAALLAGPQIILLMPCWLFGSLAAKKGNAWTQKARHPTLLFISGSITLTLTLIFIPDWPGALNKNSLRFSSAFISDWLMAAAFSVMILAIQAMQCREPSSNWVKRFRKLGDYTFPIYLLHYPLMVFFAAVWPINPHDVWSLRFHEACLIAVLITLSHLCERMRPLWRPWVLSALTPMRDWLSPRMKGV